MARPKNLENMSTVELQQLQDRIAKAKEDKRKAEASSLRNAMAAMAKERGFDIKDLLGR